jgi:hypothetical protein
MINQLRDTKRNLMEQLTLAYKDVGGPRDVLEDLKSRMAMVDAELQSLYDDSGRPSVVTDFESRPQLEAPAVRRQIAADGALDGEPAGRGDAE